MGTRKNRLNEAVLTCIHNIYVLSKHMKIVKKYSTENCHFYSHGKSLYIAWACFRNDFSCLQVSGSNDISYAFPSRFPII